ncbi:MAG TPA: 4Fe-4S binding protein [Myxococcota bacterium]|nr:4Fe-4S binding protein [Myxococcota bacterium]
MDRRTFVKGIVSGGVIMAVPGLTGCAGRVSKVPRIANTNPSRALVAWYSQTGHTAQIGRVIADAWRKAGLVVDARDYRDIQPSAVTGYDMIAVGTPVFYMNVPDNLRDWLAALPPLDGVAAASFVTFGGHGDGQEYTCARLLSLLADKGAAPVGSGMSGNMSTFAPTWSSGNSARTLKYRHLPDQDTFRLAAGFADRMLAAVRRGETVNPSGLFGFQAIGAALPQVALTKLAMSEHHIDLKTCIRCELCVEKCPTDSIALGAGTVDAKTCLACFGCVNNCPTGAMRMRFAGHDVWGFTELLKRNDIKIQEPTV